MRVCGCFPSTGPAQEPLPSACSCLSSWDKPMDSQQGTPSRSSRPQRPPQRVTGIRPAKSPDPATRTTGDGADLPPGSPLSPRGPLSAPGVPSQPPGSPPSPWHPLSDPRVPSRPPAFPLSPRRPLSAPRVPSQPLVSPLSPQGPLSAPGIPSQPPGVPLRPLPQSQRPCLCSHVSSILTQPLPWPCPEPPDASGRGLHTLAPRTPLVILLRAQPGVTLSSEVTAAARLSLLKDPALAAPQEQAERGPGAQSHSPHDLPEPNLPRLREEGAWCALV